MASGDMEGIQLVSRSSSIFPHLSLIQQCEGYKIEHKLYMQKYVFL